MTENPGPNAHTMLEAFRAENARSFRDSIELSFEATQMSEPGAAREIPWRIDGRKPARVLPAAGIFGANASGKSNVLRALRDMQSFVRHSFSKRPRDGNLPRYPFALDPDCENRPTRFEVDLILDGIRHSYGFIINDTHILSEWALRFTNGKPATIFRRTDEKIRFGESVHPDLRAVQKIVRDNSLFLSAAFAADCQDVLSLGNWFDSGLKYSDASSRSRSWRYTTMSALNGDRRSLILELIRAADLGIVDIKKVDPDPAVLKEYQRIIKALKEGNDDGIKFDDIPKVYAMVHQGTTDEVSLDIDDESLGTLSWMGIIGPIVNAIAEGTVLLADELEASLHPSLVSQLVRMFQDSETNPYGAQLLFNSHEPYLLSGPEDRIIGRDQIWFTEKGNDGASILYPLTDLNPRKREAIDRRYMQGRYGGTPILSAQEFTQAMHRLTGGSEEK